MATKALLVSYGMSEELADKAIAKKLDLGQLLKLWAVVMAYAPELQKFFSDLIAVFEPPIVPPVVQPIPASPSFAKGSPKMAKITLVKKSAQRKAAGRAAKGLAIVDFQLQDNGDDTFTVLGVDAGGNTADISSIATLTATSDNPSVLTVDTPVGMTSAMHAVGPLGSANITAVATWNDGSIGPFTVTLPVTVIAGPVTGVVIVPGTPTVH